MGTGGGPFCSNSSYHNKQIINALALSFPNLLHLESNTRKPNRTKPTNIREKMNNTIPTRILFPKDNNPAEQVKLI